MNGMTILYLRKTGTLVRDVVVLDEEYKGVVYALTIPLRLHRGASYVPQGYSYRGKICPQWQHKMPTAQTSTSSKRLKTSLHPIPPISTTSTMTATAQLVKLSRVVAVDRQAILQAHRTRTIRLAARPIQALAHHPLRRRKPHPASA